MFFITSVVAKLPSDCYSMCAAKFSSLELISEHSCLRLFSRSHKLEIEDDDLSWEVLTSKPFLNTGYLTKSIVYYEK